MDVDAQVRKAIQKAADPERESLKLNGRGLSSFPLEVTELTHLRVLELYDNQLTSLPSEISRMVNLEKLVLASNQLTEINPALGQLGGLLELNLDMNAGLAGLSAVIQEMANLKALSVGHCDLTMLPTALGRCEDLRLLSVPFNPFDEFPRVILELRLLEYLDLSGCPVVCPKDMKGFLRNLGVLKPPPG